MTALSIGADESKRADRRLIPKWKVYGRQFSSMDILADVLYGLSMKDAEVKLRVPLSAIIDYKGFRCLAIAKVPVKSNQGPMLGFHEGRY